MRASGRRPGFPRCGVAVLALLLPLHFQGCGVGNEGRVCGTEIADPDEIMAGCLVDVEGEPASGVMVTVERSTATSKASASPGAALKDTTETNRVGRYAFKGLTPGSYRISIFDSAGRPLAQPWVEKVRSGFTSNEVDTVFGAGTIKGTVHDTVTGDPVSGATCDVPGQPFLAKTDDSGRFLLHLLPSRPGEAYSVRCARESMMDSEQDGIVVAPGSEIEIAFRMRPVYTTEVRPPEPTGLKAVYDTLKGVVRLSWRRVSFPEPIIYHVKRFDPLNIAAFKVFTTPDTFYNDYIFPPEPDSSGPGKPMDLIYNVRTSFLNSYTLSHGLAYAEVKSVKPPPYTGPEVTLSAVDPEGEYTVGDTVRLAGGYRNPKRANRRLFWSVDGIAGELMGRTLSDSAGTDTLVYRLDAAGTTRIRFTVIDQAGISASAWIPLPAVERP